MKKILVILMMVLPLAAMSQDVAKLQKKADKGDTKAMLELAKCYTGGHNVPVDTAKAVEFVQRAVAAGDADAKAQLAYYHIWYSGLPHDTATIVRLAQESASAGSAEGMARLAFCYQNAIGVPRNYSKAISLLNQAADKGSQQAILYLATGYLYGDDSIDYNPEKGLAYLKKLDEGYSSSKYSLMAEYYFGRRDLKKSWKWLQKGVANGELISCIHAAVYRFFGWEVAEDEDMAMQELVKLEEKFGNNADILMAEYRMRVTSNNGLLFDQHRCHEIMLTIGDMSGYANYDILGNSYYSGYFTYLDTAMAEYYWRKGAAKNDPQSIISLAMLMNAKGESDSVLYYANMAYELQDDYSANYLGNIYLYGNHIVPLDFDKAKAYFIESARRGNTEDLVMAGKICLWTGDTTEAFRHFDRAIAFGHVDAWVNKAYTYIESGNTKPGIDLLKKGEKAGSKQCIISLGDMAVEDEDYKKAEKYYIKADNGEGYFKQANLYLTGMLGDNGEEDLGKSIDLLRKAANYGNQDAELMLARAYISGSGVEQNPDSAIFIYRSLMDRGNSDAPIQLAFYYDHIDDTANLIQVLQDAVNRNNVRAMTMLGEKYIEGVYVPADTARGIALYRRAADISPDEMSVQLAKATMSLQGLDCPIDTAAALPHLRNSVELGSGWAAAQIGDMFQYGRGGLPADHDSAFYYYYLASKQDYPQGDFMVGSYYDGWGHADVAMSYYLSAMQNGHQQAYVEVARGIQSGLGIESDPVTAYEMATRAANEWNNADAYMLLGYARLFGLGCDADTALAVEYTQTAANAGSVQAMMNMAAMYTNGLGLETDTMAAIEWYERAAATGYSKAMLKLANMLLNGEGMTADKKRAAELYQQAADLGNVEAMCRLGLCYEQGEGVILNSRKAFNLYNTAADRGYAWAMRLVGLCYAEGIYVQQDDEQTAQWLLKAAEAGDLQSCFFIGMLYAEGQGVKKDKKEAKKWLTIAAENGMEEAQEALENL